MISLTEQQVRELADVDQVMHALRRAFSRDFSSTLRMPVRSSLDIEDGVLLLMPAYDTELQAAGVKTVTVTSARGVNASYELFSPVTGEVLARMEANYLTDLRTACISAIATDMLARPDAHTLAVFGTGRQAAAHFAVLPRVRSFRRHLVCASGRSDVSDFLSRMRAEHGIEIESVNAETCAGEADVLCTCTTSREPLFDGRWLKPGSHLNLIGAFQPKTREVDDLAIQRSRVIVDTYSGALAEAGDILIPLQRGIITRDHITADLHEIVSGKKPGRTDPGDITLFKSVGCALEDLVTAQLIYKRASA